jgi:hypothetical protein
LAASRKARQGKPAARLGRKATGPKGAAGLPKPSETSCTSSGRRFFGGLPWPQCAGHRATGSVRLRRGLEACGGGAVRHTAFGGARPADPDSTSSRALAGSIKGGMCGTRRAPKHTNNTTCRAADGDPLLGFNPARPPHGDGAGRDGERNASAKRRGLDAFGQPGGMRGHGLRRSCPRPFFEGPPAAETGGSGKPGLLRLETARRRRCVGVPLVVSAWKHSRRGAR